MSVPDGKTEEADVGVGLRIEGPVRTMTVERLMLYGVSLASAVAGRPTPAPRNIHTDEAYAQQQGWPNVIADGMITANWIHSMLADRFGRSFLETGELSTKFIRPVTAGDVVRVGAEVVGVEEENGRKRLQLSVWCTDGGERPFTVGDASVTI